MLRRLLLALFMATPLAAQSPGDSVRVRFTPGSEWVAGRLVELGRDSIRIQQFRGDLARRLQSESRVEVWRRQNPGIALLLGGLAGAAGGGLAVATMPDDREPFTGSNAGDVLVSTGIGVALGGIFYLVSPGKWKRVPH